MKHVSLKNTRKCTKIKTTMTKIERLTTKTETVMTKNETCSMEKIHVNVQKTKRQ